MVTEFVIAIIAALVVYTVVSVTMTRRVVGVPVPPIVEHSRLDLTWIVVSIQFLSIRPILVTERYGNGVKVRHYGMISNILRHKKTERTLIERKDED